MPDLNKCVKASDGTLYYWDGKEVVRIVFDKPVIATIPPEILVQLLRKTTGEGENR